MSNFDSNNTNILDQIGTYSQSSTENFIYSIKDEIRSQEKLNKVLREDDHDKNIIDIKNFIKRNLSNIDEQLKTLQDLSSKIKDVVGQNKEENDCKKKYDEILNSEECINTATKLREIKKIKDDLIYFLDTAGIWKLH